MTSPDYQAGQDIDLDPWQVMGSPIQTYTPALLGSTTNPTLGTGSIQEGWWAQAARFISFWGRIRFGTSGTNAGSGNYRITGPVPAPAIGLASGTIGAGIPVGRGVVRDNTAVVANARSITLQMATETGGPGGEATFMLLILDGTNTQATDAVPFAWSTEDSITFSGFYPTN